MPPFLVALAALSLTLTAPAAVAGPKGCPPGLAKQNSACLPPGQARKQAQGAGGFRVGDRIDSDYVVVTQVYRYGLDPRGTYWRVGNRVFQVDPDTGAILAIVGGLSQLMN